MDQLSHWWPTITTAAFVVGIAFVADANIRRHDGTITNLVGRVGELETKVAVLEERTKNE